MCVRVSHEVLDSSLDALSTVVTNELADALHATWGSNDPQAESSWPCIGSLVNFRLDRYASSRGRILPVCTAASGQCVAALTQQLVNSFQHCTSSSFIKREQ